MRDLLNKTFFKFLVRFIFIILIGVVGVFIAGIVNRVSDDSITATVEE